MSGKPQKSGRKRWDKLAWVRNGLVYLWLTVGTMRDKPSHMKHPRLKADYAEVVLSNGLRTGEKES
jgi:hypothetical protein